MEEKVSAQYTDDNIQVLEGLEAVRKRPGMYIATTSKKGLHHLVWEIVDNSIDESLAGHCNTIIVTIKEDNSVEVIDNGRGIPTGTNPKTGVSTVETIFTVLHAGGKFGEGGGYKVSGGLHGVGGAVVNALSKKFEVWVCRDGKKYYQCFANGGHPVKPLEVIGESDTRGTTVRFLPDETIFTETTIFDYNLMRDRIRQLAFLNKGLKLILRDERVEPFKEEEFFYEGGLEQYVQFLNENKTTLHQKVVYVEGEQDGIEIEVSAQYNDSYHENIYTFCNNIFTHEGGTHLEGFRLALNKVINKYAIDKKFIKEDDKLTIDDITEGLTAVISVKHPNPQYEGQTKTKLGNSEVRKVVNNIFSEQLEKFLYENPIEAKTIIEKNMLASKARIAAKKAREHTRKSALGLGNSLPGKLRDCSSKDASKCEIFLVEGDSAGGSATQGRNREFQAILPLRGKILNVEKARLDKVLENQEISTMITAFGTSFSDQFDIEKLRYHKIVIMTDADVDGSHIRILLLTFFYRYLKDLVEQGHIYIAQPPLFKVQVGKQVDYAYNDQQMEDIRAKYGPNVKLNIQRYKGLGEMDAEQLWETTMDPERRVLIKVNVEDAAKADEIFDKLMGEKVEPRKDYIIANAASVENLDI